MRYVYMVLLALATLWACSDGELEGDLFPVSPDKGHGGPEESDGKYIDALIESMVKIPGGTFMMGSERPEAEKDEAPEHLVTLTGFYISRYEVPQILWATIMGTNPSQVKNDPYNYDKKYESSFPVTNVSYTDCLDFIRKLNEKTGMKFALPTEAQWEVAARGRYSKSYGDNDVFATDNFYYESNSYRTLHRIDSYSGNSFGLYCMSGNVLEWCADWYKDYSSEAQTDPVGPTTGDYRVFRGGGCLSKRVECRVCSRNGGYPSSLGSDCGLRLVLNGNMNLLVSPKNLEFTKAGGTKTVNVETSSETVFCKSLDTWCTPVYSGGKVTVKVDPNSGRKRSTTLEISVDKEKEIVTVEQEGTLFEIQSGGVGMDTLNIDGKGIANKIFTINQSGSATWTVRSLDDSWCHVNKTGTTFSVTANENPSKTAARTTRVIVSAGTSLYDTLWVIQKKSMELFQILYDDGVSYDTLRVGSNGCYKNLTLLKETSDYWFVESSASWCRVSRTTGTTGISLTVDAHQEEWNDRYAYIRAYTGSGLQDIVQIVQKKKIDLVVNWKGISTAALVYGCENYGGYKDCSVTTKASWVVSSGDDSWCHVINKTSSGFRIVVDESTKKRETYVEVDAEGVKHRVVVKQNMLPRVGDYYNKNGIKGIVYEANYDDMSGKIVSLTESSNRWSLENRQTYANSDTDGEANMITIRNLSASWASYYPAFYDCYLQGGWYLPARYELRDLFAAVRTYGASKFDQALSDNGGQVFSSASAYWSSTELSSSYYAYGMDRQGSETVLDKSSNYRVRAIRRVTFD